MLRRVIELVAGMLKQPRIIYDQAGRVPYLSRYYLFGAPTHPSGEPFDRYGDTKPETKWSEGRWGLYLHKFHRGDQDPELHSHPWRWSVSLILVGGYLEERRVGLGDVVQNVFEPGSLNWIWANTFHRVDLLERDAWTLFLVGPKSQSWSFWNRETGILTPWREFISDKRDAAAHARERVRTEVDALKEAIGSAREALAAAATRRQAQSVLRAINGGKS